MSAGSSSSSSSAAHAPVYAGLMEFIPSSDDQLNETVPPGLSTSGQLAHILDKGILSPAAMVEQGLTFQGGYDVGISGVVFLNLITKETGIIRAVFHPADGVFSVGIERTGDHEWIRSIADEAEVDKIFHEKFSDIANPDDPFYPLARDTALGEHLKQNPRFLDELAKRVNNLVVLVLDIPPVDSDILTDPSGCHDAIRKMVPRENICRIVTTKQLEDASEVAFVALKKVKPVHLAPLKDQKITYVYEKLNSDGVEKKKIEVVINAPDFSEVLREIFRSSFSREKPMFLHVTRL